MNVRALVLVSLVGALASSLAAQPGRDPHAPVPVDSPPPNQHDKSLLTPPEGENQRVYGSTQSALISLEEARDLSARFRATYAKEAAPRIVVYVNRALVETGGLRLTGRTEKFNETTTTNESGAGATSTVNTTGENTYAATDASAPNLADQQTVREIERLFGRVFRHAGARLADPKIAASLLADQAAQRLAGREAVRQREALKQVADYAIEVLISSRSLTVRELSGDRTIEVPDIQATAIRLSDSAIVGQAASSDVLGGGGQARNVARQFGTPDITEATAFVLMEDMLTGHAEPAAAP